MLGSVDGAIAEVADLRIPVADDGLLRGDGGFEVLRLYGGVPFRLDDHLERLGRTCAGLRLGVDLDAVRAEVDALLRAATPGDAALRLVATRGGRRLALLEPLPAAPPPTLRVKPVTYTPTRVLDGLKTLSYAANVLATRLAQAEGWDEALLVTPHGRVLEGPTWTVFWADEHGRLKTPPLSERVLDSITRRTLLEDAELGATEAVCVLDEDLRGSHEAFLASTTREVVPLAAVGDLELPAAPGPRTAAAAAALRAAITRAVG